MSRYADKLARLRAGLSAGGPGGIGLAKSTSNLFRDRERQAHARVEVGQGTRVVVALTKNQGTRHVRLGVERIEAHRVVEVVGGEVDENRAVVRKYPDIR